MLSLLKCKPRLLVYKVALSGQVLRKPDEERRYFIPTPGV